MNDSNIKEFDPILLDILVCPVSHGRLQYDKEKQELICKKSELTYPIKNGIPILLQEEARNIDI